jgi:hypothetical protein
MKKLLPLLLLILVFGFFGCNDDDTYFALPTFEIFRLDAVMRYADLSYDQIIGAWVPEHEDGDTPQYPVIVSRDARQMIVSIQIDSDLYVASQHIVISNKETNEVVASAVGINDPHFYPGEITAAFEIRFYVVVDGKEIRFFPEDEYTVQIWLTSSGGRTSSYSTFDFLFAEEEDYCDLYSSLYPNIMDAPERCRDAAEGRD